MSRFPSRFAVLALAVTAGCNTNAVTLLPPLDANASFHFPTGMAVKRLTQAPCTPARGAPCYALLVVSSNFDLQFDQATGGTLLAVDPEGPNALPVCDPQNPALKTCCDPDPAKDTCGAGLTVLGATRMGSFGGEVGVADPDDNCPQLKGLRPNALTRVVTTSRSENQAYWMTMDGQGQLACGGSTGAACPIPLVNPAQLPGTQLGDAFGVTMGCSGGPPDPVIPPRASAFVTHLHAANDEGWVSSVALVNSADTTNKDAPPQLQAPDLDFKDLGAGDTYSGAFDETKGRLYVTSRFGNVGTTPLRWLDLAVPLPQAQVTTSNLYTAIRGSLTRGLALSTDASHSRGYLAVQIYDTNLASSSGSIVTVASVLAVLDLQPDPSGNPTFQVLRTVPVPAGPTVVKVLPPRTGKRDLVAVTCTDDGALVLYDDEIGAVVASIGIDRDTGNPILGKQPFGIAVEPRPAAGCRSGAACDRLYVGSFDRSWVNVVELDPGNPAGNPLVGWDACTTQVSCPALVKRIGRER